MMKVKRQLKPIPSKLMHQSVRQPAQRAMSEILRRTLYARYC